MNSINEKINKDDSTYSLYFTDSKMRCERKVQIFSILCFLAYCLFTVAYNYSNESVVLFYSISICNHSLFLIIGFGRLVISRTLPDNRYSFGISRI